ncbi:DUF1467 family protein [Mangrovicoccus algicola]|uniref:DUF1467 family protein n=1 Tax=Mangrovicoccus algicola TaxID=2771008 RepID=A0A8J6YU50_9RHOB|nr:DUF1467 family protein [Mangrovicoccus algicola]MBE3639318.1 DUF1467 family protein [Mangrovicoccus algicola]
MSITSAIVLFAVIWWLTFFVVLPLRLKSQAEAGQVVPGTPVSAPTDPRLRRKAAITTLVAAILWAVIAGVILSGAITVRDFDVMHRMGPAAAARP